MEWKLTVVRYSSQFKYIIELKVLECIKDEYLDRGDGVSAWWSYYETWISENIN